MYNYVFLVGRIVRDLEVHQAEGGKKVSTLTLAVNRGFKNPQTNAYDVDFIDVVLWEPICDNVKGYTKKGDMVGVKGRVSTYAKEGENNAMVYKQEIVAERVIFMSTNKQIED